MAGKTKENPPIEVEAPETHNEDDYVAIHTNNRTVIAMLSKAGHDGEEFMDGDGWEGFEFQIANADFLKMVSGNKPKQRAPSNRPPRSHEQKVTKYIDLMKGKAASNLASTEGIPREDAMSRILGDETFMNELRQKAEETVTAKEAAESEAETETEEVAA